MSAANTHKSLNWKLIFFVFLFAFTILKFWLFIQEYTFVRFGSDTGRHLYLYQEIFNSESIPTNQTTNYVAYLPGQAMSPVSYYPRGGHMWMSLFSKVTNIDIVYAVNVFAILLVLAAAGIVYSLSQLLFERNEKISMLSSTLFVGTVYLFNITSHYFVAYLVIPMIVYALLRYLKEGQKKFLFLFALFSIGLQILHANYAILFLVILTAYGFFEEIMPQAKEQGVKLLQRLHTMLAIYYTIYILAFIHYFNFLDLEFSEWQSFFSEYSGIWSISSNNDLGVLIGVGGIGLLYVYFVFRTFIKSKGRGVKKEFHLPTLSQVARKRENQLWGLFMALLFFSIISQGISESFIDFTFGSNSDLARLENYPLIILFIISLFGIRRLLNELPRFFLWAYLPMFALVFIAVILLKVPFIGGPFHSTLSATFAVLDFSVVFLSIIGGYMLFHILSRHEFRTKLISTGLIFIGLTQFSVLAMHENLYNRTNPYQNVVEAYFWLKPKIEASTNVGTNFEYMRALTRINRGDVIPTMNDRKLKEIRLDEFILENDMDYFVYVPWIAPFFPERQWFYDLESNSKIEQIYNKDSVKIYKSLK
jgi:hypothetical protein